MEKTVESETNQGYGEVVRKGMTLGVKSGTEYVVCLHADGQYPPEKLGEFVEYMRSRSIFDGKIRKIADILI